jgi:hypothetical protein
MQGLPHVKTSAQRAACIKRRLCTCKAAQTYHTISQQIHNSTTDSPFLAHVTPKPPMRGKHLQAPTNHSPAKPLLCTPSSMPATPQPAL